MGSNGIKETVFEEALIETTVIKETVIERSVIAGKEKGDAFFFVFFPEKEGKWTLSGS